ncbi:MAG TPA: hypothetical protein PK668_23550 [Myxococcota bacterium]|nr:hypothetical protein [Myxococcota bacterium]HRY96474.1 hypothetical protein [Myxococcota bacterium]HSA23721.1 hypothetical protein [Myxococcota bacterium]
MRPTGFAETCLLGGLLGATLLWPAPARALWGDTQGPVGLEGSVRATTAAAVLYDHPLFGQGADGGANRADGLGQLLLRLVCAGRPLDWLAFEVHGLQEVGLQSGGQSGLGFPGAGGGAAGRYRAWDGRWAWGEEGDVTAALSLDRLAVRLSTAYFDLTLGRQAISFGKTYFWNPLDVFQGFDPRQFDRDYKPGVDAARLDVPLGDTAGLTLVGAFGRSPSRDAILLDPPGARTRVVEEVGVDWYGSAVLLRAYATFWDWDFTLQGGKVYGGYQVAGGLAGELGPLEVRAEGGYHFALDGPVELFPAPSHGSAVAGLGHTFDCSLSLQLEYLYNGAGAPGELLTALLRVADGNALHLGTHLLGLSVSYELTGLVKGSLAFLVSASDGSSLLQPGLSASVSDEAELVAGALIAFGARPTGPSALQPGLQSEFGTYPNFYYLEFKYYF